MTTQGDQEVIVSRRDNQTFSETITRDPRTEVMAAIFGEEYASKFRDPVMFLHETFQSPAPLHFYKRDYKFLSRNLFVENVYRRRREFDQNVLDQYSLTLGKRLTELQQLLTVNNERMRDLIAKNGDLDQVVYLQARSIEIPIIAAHARSYIQLLKKMDEAYQLSGAAMLQGIFDGSQKTKAELDTRRAVRAFAGLVRAEQVKIYKEAQRVMKSRAAVRDQEMEDATNTLVQARDDYDRESSRDDAVDTAGAVDFREAEEVIDNLVTTTTAAAKVAVKRTRVKKAEAPVEAAEKAAA